MVGSQRNSPDSKAKKQSREAERAADARATQGLARKIDTMRTSRSKRTERWQRGSKNATDLSRGIRLATEFSVAILVGAGMGYVFDGWFNTRPWIMITMLALGFAAGIKNVLMTVEEMNAGTVFTDEMNLRSKDESDDSMWDDLDD